MKSFAERNPLLVGAAGVTLTLGLVIGSLEYDKLPFVNPHQTISAYFTEAGGVTVGTPVQVSGYEVGHVGAVELDGNRVRVDLDLNKGIKLGDRTEAAIKTNSLLGAKLVQVTPRGDVPLHGPIPTERTQPPYKLPDALGDITTEIRGLDTRQLSDSLETLSQTFRDSPADLRVSIEGLGRFSQTLNSRDDQLRNLLTNANKATTVLAKRSDQVVGLVSDTNKLLLALQTQSKALDEISSNISSLTQQLTGVIGENRNTLKPALDKLNDALTVVDNRKTDVQASIKKLNAYAMSLGESVSSGPFFQAYIVNLLPGQFVQPFIDAAFSDLGVDPNVKRPSELPDPQVGQRATPPLPIPYPRTGQGGEPRRNLPDAITGKPGEQGCGPAGLPLPGPTGCYPYRDPGPAPLPGGPPPGPPAQAPPGLRSAPVPTGPSPIFVPAPGEPATPAAPRPQPLEPPR